MQISGWTISWQDIIEIAKQGKPVSVVAYNGKPIYCYPDALPPNARDLHYETLCRVFEMGFPLTRRVVDGYPDLEMAVRSQAATNEPPYTKI